MRALLVDDDHELARLLRDYLAPHGVSVDHVEEGVGAIERIGTAAVPYDIVLLDVMLPGIDGFEVCRRIRARHDVPIVMLTARGDDADRVVGLEIGADDYLPKPFNPRELLARMRAVLRRAHPAPAARAAAGGRGADGSHPGGRPARRRARPQGHPGGPRAPADVVRVPGARGPRAPRRRAGHARGARERRAPQGGAYDPSVDRSLDVHVSHLRQKMGDGGREPRRIRTVRGIGYVLVRRAERRS